MSFEDRLLHQLQSVVAANQTPREGRRRSWAVAGSPRRIALGGAAVAAVAIAAVAVVQTVSGGAAPAYAVTRNDDGTVTVEISSLSDAAGLQSKLREAGVPAVVQYLPLGKACRQPWFTPAGTPAPGAGPAIRGGVQHTSDGRTRFTISKNLPADVTLVIMTQVGSPAPDDNAEAVGVALAQGEVPPCQIVDAPAGSLPFGGKPGAGTRMHTENGPAQGLSSSTSHY